MAEIFSASSQARLKVRLVTVRSSAPRSLRARAVFSPISPLPITKILVEERSPKIRKARSQAMLPMLI